ncbi:MAG TPA: transposase, partial [Pirellulales bacterium]|nr:transposase [Pirellulales bacterium]
HRGWRLWAAHVRSRHVHVVVTGQPTPEKVMNDFKSYASRALNESGPAAQGGKRWTRHGSTRYVNDPAHLDRAIQYVLERQGSIQEVFDGR